MEMISRRFLIVDDDPLNNIISKMALKKTLGQVEIRDFVDPELALDFIKSEYVEQRFEEKCTILLDINMPSLNGWEFLEAFSTFPYTIINQFNIYLLSSSIANSDILQAKQNKMVINLIEKPLTKAKVLDIFS